jgi:hypothetical protein
MGMKMKMMMKRMASSSALQPGSGWNSASELSRAILVEGRAGLVEYSPNP